MKAEQVGEYTLLDLVGEGSFGKVRKSIVPVVVVVGGAVVRGDD